MAMSPDTARQQVSMTISPPWATQSSGGPSTATVVSCGGGVMPDTAGCYSPRKGGPREAACGWSGWGQSAGGGVQADMI